MEKTREEVIELAYMVEAVERKAACRQVNCAVLDKLIKVAEYLHCIDGMLTEIIGD